MADLLGRRRRPRDGHKLLRKPGYPVPLPRAENAGRRDARFALVQDRLGRADEMEQIHADIRRIVKALPESQQEVLVMRYYKNMSFKEIADATNVSINTALGRMRYAILNMRRIAEENNIVLTAI